MSDRLSKVVHYLVDPMVEDGDEVRVHRVKGDASTLLELRVSDDDRDMLLGDERRVFRAMQQVLAVSSRKRGVKPVLELVENDAAEDLGEDEE